MTFTIPPVKPFPKCHGIHSSPCSHCPSIISPNDPESQDIREWPKEERIKTAFACAWRLNKHCKGYCDMMGITEGDLRND